MVSGLMDNQARGYPSALARFAWISWFGERIVGDLDLGVDYPQPLEVLGCRVCMEDHDSLSGRYYGHGPAADGPAIS